MSKAAEQGDVDSQLTLGAAYYNNNDYSNAFKWWSKAAAKGHAYAMNCIGVFYENGLSVTKSIPTAIYWYKKAGDKGNQEAVDNYKRLYNQGYRESATPQKRE